MFLFLLPDLEMASRHIIFTAFWVSVWIEVPLVEAAQTCQTNANCANNYIYKHCCGNYPKSFDRTKRTCQITYCLNKYCATNSDCGDSSLCCRFNKCVHDGCFGCAVNSDCDFNRVCCKKTHISSKTFCAANCVGQSCISNDDCAGSAECCRSGKCVDTASCLAQCKSNSECNVGNYCCKKRSVWFWQDRCRENCVGEKCSSNDDCGPADECCNAAGICAKRCQKPNGAKQNDKEQNYNVNEQNNKKSFKVKNDKAQNGKQRNHTKQSEKSNKAWLIPVIVVVGLLITVVIFIAVFHYYRKRREMQNYTTQINCDTM